jgi:hypothetical protein
MYILQCCKYVYSRHHIRKFRLFRLEGVMKVAVLPKTMSTVFNLTHTHVRVNPFQSCDAIWHHNFNSVLHMLQFWGDWEGLTSPKKL